MAPELLSIVIRKAFSRSIRFDIRLVIIFSQHIINWANALPKWFNFIYWNCVQNFFEYLFAILIIANSQQMIPAVDSFLLYSFAEYSIFPSFLNGLHCVLSDHFLGPQILQISPRGLPLSWTSTCHWRCGRGIGPCARQSAR